MFYGIFENVALILPLYGWRDGYIWLLDDSTIDQHCYIFLECAHKMLPCSKINGKQTDIVDSMTINFAIRIDKRVGGDGQKFAEMRYFCAQLQLLIDNVDDHDNLVISMLN